MSKFDKEYYKKHAKNRYQRRKKEIDYSKIDADNLTRKCNLCHKTKRLKEFHRVVLGVNGYASKCKVCQKEYIRNHSLKRNHGITSMEYDIMATQQRNKCAICGCMPRKNRLLCVDHSHKTNKIRGLLCDRCNRGLGMWFDNVGLMEKAIKYLKFYRKD